MKKEKERIRLEKIEEKINQKDMLKSEKFKAFDMFAPKTPKPKVGPIISAITPRFDRSNSTPLPSSPKTPQQLGTKTPQPTTTATPKSSKSGKESELIRSSSKHESSKSHHHHSESKSHHHSDGKSGKSGSGGSSHRKSIDAHRDTSLSSPTFERRYFFHFVKIQWGFYWQTSPSVCDKI